MRAEPLWLGELGKLSGLTSLFSGQIASLRRLRHKVVSAAAACRLASGEGRSAGAPSRQPRMGSEIRFNVMLGA